MKTLLFALFALLLFSYPPVYADNPKAEKAEAVTKANAENPVAAAAAQSRFDSFQAAAKQRVTDAPVSADPSGFWKGILANWPALLLGVFTIWEIVARITPTTRDNTFLAFLKSILDKFIPNRIQ